MARTISTALPVALAIICVANYSTGYPSNELKQSLKALKEEPIGGFIFYRINPTSKRIEYLLLKKTDENDWTPPKGNIDPNLNESEIDTAIRETREETTYLVGDYVPHIQYKVYFEYTTKDDELKMVHLWPAKLTNFDKEIVLSPENERYEWLEYAEASVTIKEQYADGFRQGDSIVRAIESA